jgi:hypothetical protein
MMQPEVDKYNERQNPSHRAVCDLLGKQIEHNLPRSKGLIWHAHPVSFLGDHPVVGYNKQKPGIRLMFWSGADFGEPGLNVLGKKFKDESVFFHDTSEVNTSWALA